MKNMAPLIGITSCTQHTQDFPKHRVGAEYIGAIASACNALPVLIPALGSDLDIAGLLERLDGILLTGSPSNVDPARYGSVPEAADLALDLDRDATTFPLIHQALAKGVPLFGICRGFQELNVALGGSLHQFVHLQAGMMDHRWHDTDPLEVQYRMAHSVALAPGGILQNILGGKETIQVNSLHWQGVKDLSPALSVEAFAEDGLVEAVSVMGAPAFALAVQWHPEYKALENPVSMALFGAFAEACNARLASRGKT
jgi:putative glutamine amidotransferase